MRRFSIAAAALLATLGPSQGQQDIEWKQVFDMPRGQNIPRGSGDVLGIELGDGYADVRTKLQALLAETGQKEQERMGRPLQEQQQVFRMQVPGASTLVTASFIAKITLNRELKGSTDRPVNETIEVYFSAPSSGHQVIAVQRFVVYNAEADQPRVSEMMGQLKAKMRSDHQVFPNASSGVYRFQFDGGRPHVPARASIVSCQTSLHALTSANALNSINTSGDCDAVLEVTVNYGLSRDHAKSIIFVLSDNERVKANLSADYRYVSDYIRGLGERTRGAPPRL